MKRRRLILIRISLALGMPLLFLILAEAVLRVATTRAVYFSESNPHFRDSDGVVRLSPDTSTWWYGCHYEINSNGFRMPSEVGPKQGPRILGLGDSVTLGMGVRRTKDVWPNKLETLCRERGFASADAINSGVQGWNLLRRESGTNLVAADFTRFVAEQGPKLKPDFVVYCICLNDVPSRVDDLFEIDNARNKQRFRFFPESLREWFKRKAIYRLARDGYRESRFRKLDFSGLPTPPRSDKFWEQVSDELGRLKSEVEAAGAKLYCVIVPYSYQLLPQNDALLELNRRWQEALDRNAIPWKDVTTHFDEKNVLEYFSLGDYIHLNTRGHRLIAGEAFELIEHDLRAHASK